MLLAFARALGEFGATIMVAGNIPGRTHASLAIYQSVQLGHDADAFRLLAISVVLAFAAVWWSEWLPRRGTDMNLLLRDVPSPGLFDSRWMSRSPPTGRPLFGAFRRRQNFPCST